MGKLRSWLVSKLLRKIGEVLRVKNPLKLNFKLFIIEEEDDKRLIRAYELIKGGEEMLIYSREAVMETTKSKSLFLATLSHKIRTPVNGIVGALNLLIGSELDSINYLVF